MNEELNLANLSGLNNQIPNYEDVEDSFQNNCDLIYFIIFLWCTMAAQWPGREYDLRILFLIIPSTQHHNKVINKVKKWWFAARLRLGFKRAQCTAARYPSTVESGRSSLLCETSLTRFPPLKETRGSGLRLGPRESLPDLDRAGRHGAQMHPRPNHNT